jgi:polyhydroxyalkanoate synthesis regulator protein
VPEAKYVSLGEIRDFLQSGKKIKVIEKSTGKDITKYIMVQVLLEERYDLLPTYFYQMILQSPKSYVEQFFKNFFPWMMEYYTNMQEGKMPQMPQFPQMPINPMSGQNPWMQGNPFMNQMSNPFMGSQTTPNSDKQGEDKMDEILKRLQELESKIKP